MTKRAESTERSSADGAAQRDPITIKKYANRRLYNTQTSSYVTLDYLSDMVKSGQDFNVFDAKTGEDITRSVLTQIIFEEENKGQNLLPIQFLRQLIRFYGDSMQSFVPSYLEMSMDAFTSNQDKLRQQVSETFGAGTGYKMFEETVRQNMAFFDQAMKMFAPFGKFYGQPGGPEGGEPGAHGQEAAKAADPADITELKAQITALQRRLDQMGGER